MKGSDDSEQQVWLEQYKQCFESMRFEREVYWRRFGVLLLLDSGILSVMGFILNQTPQVLNSLNFQGFLISICVSSYLFNVIWIFLNGRSHNYFLYWLSQAKLLEEKRASLKICTNLGKYFREKVLYPHSRMSVTTGAQVIPICFAGIFLLTPFLFSNLWYIAVIFDTIFTLLLIYLGITMWGSGYTEVST